MLPAIALTSTNCSFMFGTVFTLRVCQMPMQPKKGVVRPNAATWEMMECHYKDVDLKNYSRRSCPTLRMYGVWSSYVCTEFQPQIHVYGLRQYRVRLVLEFREMVEPAGEMVHLINKPCGWVSRKQQCLRSSIV